MAYIGNRTSQGYVTITKDSFSGNNSNTDFTLSKSATVNEIEVFVENVRQEPTTAYTVSGTTLSFTGTPPTGTNNIYVIHSGNTVSSSTYPSAYDLSAVKGTFTGTVDINGNELILDADADTSITADTDDQIDIKVSGADDFRITANTLTALSGSSIATDTISETTSGSGVTIDGVLLKDGGIDVNGNEIILDADADTSITSDTDDVIHFKIAGSDKVSMGGANSEMDLTGSLGLRIIKSSETNYSIVSGDDGVATHLANRIDGTTAHGQIVWTTRDGGSTVERARITASGELQLGRNTTVADCGATLTMTGANGSNAAQTFRIENNGENGQTRFKRNIGGGSEITDAIISYHNYWKFTMDGNHVAATGQYYEFYQTYQTWTIVMEQTNANPWGYYFNYHAAPDNDTNYFLAFDDGDGTTARLRVDSDGDVKNHDNSYGAISDERIKQDIKDANSQWDDIKAIKIRNFKKKDDVRQYGDKAWEQIGVIAQELEAVSPKLIKGAEPTKGDIISSSDFGTLVDDTTKPDTYYEEGDTIPDGKQVGDAKTYKKKVEIKEKVKAVKYSILYMKAIKALQEAMTRIETLEAKVKVLEGE